MTASQKDPARVEDDSSTGALIVVNPTLEPAPQLAAGDCFLAQIYLDGLSSLARDRLTVTSHWQALTSVPTAQTLATTLANGMTSWLGGSHSGAVTVYASDFSPAGTYHPPLAQVKMTGGTIGDHGPGEIALCLSYYASFNVKRQRGRNYVPFNWIYTAMDVSATPPAARPTATMMNIALGLWTNVYKPVKDSNQWQWVLKSRTDKAHKIITNVWVDDEWDTMRSRGLRGTTRVQANA
jgi:hypothetical protein